MMECCPFTYIKFRTENGELDDEKWIQIMKEYEKQYPELSEQRIMHMFLRPCTCDCHRKNIDMMH